MTDTKNIPQQEFFIKCYYVFLCYLVGGELVTKPLLQITHSILHIPGKIDTLALYALVALVAVAGFYGKILFNRFRFKISEIALFCVLLTVFLIGYVRSTGYNDMFFEMLKNFVMGIIAYVFYRYCDDKERLLHDFAILSVLMTFAMILLLLLAGQDELFGNTYSQYYGYMILPACIISTNETVRKKSIFYGIVAAICFIFTFLMGARGPIILELAFIIFRLIDEPIHRIGKVITTVVVSGMSVFVYFNLYTILESLNELAISFNLSNRIFGKLLKGELFVIGRDGIFNAALQIIEKHPLTGVGIGTDRIEIAKHFNTSDALGMYSHNFFIDLLLQFGIVVGIALVIGFAILLCRAFSVSRRSVAGKNVFWVMLFIGFATLLFSSNYFTYPLFFAMLAIFQSDFETTFAPERILK